MCLINDIPNLIGIYIIKVVPASKSSSILPSSLPFHWKQTSSTGWIPPALSISKLSITKGVKHSSLLVLVHFVQSTVDTVVVQPAKTHSHQCCLLQTHFVDNALQRIPHQLTSIPKAHSILIWSFQRNKKEGTS
jgi:hypothetical protein